MTHVRQQIREYVTTLVTGLASTGTNAFASRVYSIQDSELPVVLVYSNEEDVEYDTMSRPQKQARTLELIVEGVAKATADLDDVLDTIGLEVETAIAADITMGGLVKSSALIAVSIDLSGEGGQPTGRITMTYSVEYRTVETNPQVSV